MASFSSKTFHIYDDYMTPKSAWENIQHLLPKDKVIWEAFYGNGDSGSYLKELGFNTIHEPIDFFQNDKGDIIVSNPPFSLLKDILPRLKFLNKPFVMIMPSSKINTVYFRELFKNENIQLIIPRKRIQFIKVPFDPDNKQQCNFDCFYYCFNMNFERDIIWLE